MKKKFKKLSLSTETLRTLTKPALEEVAGGVTLGPACTTTDSNVTRACSLCTLACSACCP